ncbi:glycosyltransferase [Arthrospiribacter ruber]|uniref:Rhamnosyl transferase n=1 Tax=Arthrospiribacter ruber TaxID=2487934 RepID=A0A951IV40_9BACT|nr:glycosyltransferase [Arthrospiribacter ruber]MBW3466592.1 hypothetical protein [Arthrospiribacter ruber]
MFEHLLITRVNIGYKEGIWSKGHDPEKWLKERMDLFFKFCLPSVLHQTNMNFRWILYFDIQTPKELIFTFEEEIKGKVDYQIIFKQETVANFSKYFVIDLNTLVDIKRLYLITTRVDTDDLIHECFIENIQKLFNQQTFAIVNFNRGLMYHVQTGVICNNVHRSNPFMSFIEKRRDEGFRGVYSEKHTNFYHDSRKIEIWNDEPMWCFGVHGLNVSTTLKGWVNFKKIELVKKFHFKNQIFPTFRNNFKFFILTTNILLKEQKSNYRRKLYSLLK